LDEVAAGELGEGDDAEGGEATKAKKQKDDE